MRARRWTTFVLGVLLLAAPAYAYLPANIEGVVKSWMNAAGQLVKLRFASSTQSTTPSGYCDVWVDSATLNLVSRCGSNTTTVIASLSSLGCTQDGSGNLTCNSVSSLDQNSLSPVAANRWRLYDNDVNLTPDPSCSAYGQAGIISILDKDESASDNYVVCEGTTEVATLNTAMTTWATPFGLGSNATTAALTGDQCTCWLFPIAQAILDLDTISVVITTADAGADETTNIGVYSQSGATQYFTGTLTDTGTGAVATSNGTATPGTMLPGNYWFCLGYNNGASKDLRLRSAAQDAIRVQQFTQACSGGALPATLTSPTKTAANVLVPAISMTDD